MNSWNFSCKIGLFYFKYNDNQKFALHVQVLYFDPLGKFSMRLKCAVDKVN